MRVVFVGLREMSFQERKPEQSLAMHLHLNAEAIGADRDQRARLRRAAALSLGSREERIEAGIIAAAVRDELKAAIDDVKGAAQARGEKVVPHKDALRIKTRDGLWLLSDAGKLSVALVEVGLAYRMLYEEARVTAVGSQLGKVDEAAIRAASSHGAAARGLVRAYSGVRVTDIHSHVQIEAGALALRMLIGVAGEGRTVRSLVSGGRAHEKASNALRAGLCVAERRLRFTERLTRWNG